MPHFWTDINTGKELLVVSYEELVPDFYKSAKVVAKTVSISEKRGFGLRRVKRGGGRGDLASALIEYDSLPVHIKEQLADPRKALHILERFWRIESEAVRFYNDYRFDDGRSITEPIKDRYIGTASLLGSAIRLREARVHEIQSKGGAVKNLYQSLCEDVRSFEDVCKNKYGVYYDVPGNYRRFKETVETFEGLLRSEDSREAFRWLIKDYHTVSNNKRVSDAMVAFFESLFAGQKHKPTYYEVYMSYMDFLAGRSKFLNHSTGEVFNPEDKGFRMVSYDTVKRYLAAWESQVATHALRSGDRQRYMQRFKPYHDFILPKLAGSLISVDDRQPVFNYESGKRVWFYMGVDVASRCWTVWVWDKSKEGMITNFYRQMVRNYYEWGFNLPLELECESSLNSTFRNTLLREGNMFEHVDMLANNARAKYIERMFRDVRYGPEKEIEGWVARPYALAEANQNGAGKCPLLPYQTIVNNSLKIIEGWNNLPHPEIEGKSRWDVFCEQQNPDTRPINWRGIIPYIGYTRETSCHVGMVRLQNQNFLLGDKGEIALGDSLLNLMHIADGERLTVRWLDGNDGSVIKAFAYIGDAYICELLPKPRYQKAKAEQTQADLAARELMGGYVATIEGYMRRRKSTIERVEEVESTPKTVNRNFAMRMPGDLGVDSMRASYMPQNSSFERDFKECRDFEEYGSDEYRVETLPDADELEEQLIGVATPVRCDLYSRY
jgi:hypothetical protein